MKPIIEVQDLIKKYKKAEKNAVDGISFHVNEGEFFAFLGPNGAGKTTTISILTTTLFKTSGTVKIAGYDIEKEQQKVRQHIGVIFQNPSLDLNLTAEENIRFHSSLYGLYFLRPTYALMPDPYKKRVMELADILGIQQEIFKPIKTFSGGMKRKLEIIRSLMHHPSVLFLDEPTSGLDPLSRKNLWEYLKSVREKENTTIFLTTHYLEEAEDADRVCIVNKGKIISLGTPEDIKHDLTQSYLLIDASDRQKLLQELSDKKIQFKENERIHIAITPDKVYEFIHTMQTPLNYVNTHSPSLEDAYIKIINPYEENS